MRTKTLSTALVLVLLLEMVLSLSAPTTVRAALTQSDFLKTDGKFIKKNGGTGEIVTLRGTNLGGWLALEDWMSPLGEFAADRTGWSASASVNTAGAGSALDGSNTSSWNTGAAQTSGQWFQVNLGTPTLFNRAYVDAGSSATDYPRGYQILVSSDGTTWKDVASGTSSTVNTLVRFTPQVAQYIRVVQTGSSSNWWSIAEFNIFSDPVFNNSNFTATASSTGAGTTAANALDGNVSTVWTSGVAQTNGQTFSISLGKNTEVGRLLIDAGPTSASDYPRSYEVWGLTNGTWIKYASGTSTSRFTYAEFWSSFWMTDIRIVQTGSSTNWWSIAEVAVYAGGSLERTGWSVTASASAAGTVPGNVLDNNAGTLWSTGAAQANGQWFQIDMGAIITFNQVVLDTAKNSTQEQDYPRGYTIQVSRNGTNWTTVSTGTGRVKATPINFPAVGARYIKITQTGSAGNWWSIGELNVALNNDDYSLFQSLKQRFGATTTESLYTTHQNTWIQASDLDTIQSMGMNMVRLPIAWFEIVNEDGSIKSSAWTQIDWLVSQASARNMYVLLDLHTVPGGGCPWGSCGRVGPNPNEFWTNTAYQDMVVSIWQAIATRYVGNPAIAGYDLINEPLIDYGEDADDVGQKSAYYDRLYDAVRAIDPDHTIYVAAFFNWNNIAAPATYGWQNIVYELHPYDMPNAKDANAQSTVVDTTLASLAEKQNDPNWNRPVLIGEYSLYHNDDVWAKFMSGLNALNASWTNWSYKVKGGQFDGAGGYWGFYNSNANPVPIINNDSSATMTTKLGRFATSNFQPNTRFINVVSRFTKGEAWMATVPLDQTGWVATASSSAAGDAPANALDWNDATRWSSGAAQINGQWFQVNMGSKKVIDQISFETGLANKWDYPRGYQVQVSNNGTSWTTVASGQGFGHKQALPFTPQYAQYVRIVQTGSGPDWWSIAEFHVYASQSLSRTGWSASASSTGGGGSTANAIDGSLSTRWSNGIAQANGQFFQVDMARNQPFNRVLFDTGSSTSDYPRGYQVQVSQNGTSWTTVKSGANTNPAVLVEFPVQYARYIKIVQTGTASSWWSIADLQVYGELELSATGMTASASSTESGGSAANVLDGNLATRWSSGATQSPGQYFQVDFASARWFNHIVMDSGTNTNDYPREYIIEVYLQESGQWKWKTVANGEGTGPVVTANFPIVQANVIRVTLKDSSTSWWSIAEFRVFE